MKTYHDIAGDGGSGIVRQVAEQRSRIERALAGVRRIVAVGSGKGGVGKSTLTYRIATALARDGGRTAVLDADLNGPSQARLAGLGELPPAPVGDGELALPRAAHGVGVASMGSFVPESAPVDFETVAAGDAYTWRATREFSFLGQLVGAIRWGELDHLLVDLPPGTERTVQFAEFLGPRAALVLVTVPSAVSVGVVSRTVAALRAAGRSPLGYVLNMKGYHCVDCGAVKPLFPEAPIELGVPCLGSVPFDPRVAEASDRGRPLDDDAAGPASAAVRRVAARIAEALETVP